MSRPDRKVCLCALRRRHRGLHAECLGARRCHHPANRLQARIGTEHTAPTQLSTRLPNPRRERGRTGRRRHAATLCRRASCLSLPPGTAPRVYPHENENCNWEPHNSISRSTKRPDHAHDEIAAADCAALGRLSMADAGGRPQRVPVDGRVGACLGRLWLIEVSLFRCCLGLAWLAWRRASPFLDL